MRSKDLIDVLVEAATTASKCPPHYGAHLLKEMATHGEVEVLKLHTTATGDRMVVRYAGDPFYVYELVLTPFKPAELADDEFMSRRSRADTAHLRVKHDVLERV